MDSHSRIYEGVTVGPCRINRLPLATVLYCLHLLSKVFSIHLIDFWCVRISWNENQHKKAEVLRNLFIVQQTNFEALLFSSLLKFKSLFGAHYNPMHGF